MKANPDKFQFIILGNKGKSLQVVGITTKLVPSVTLIGISMDSKLNFKEHITNTIKKHTVNYMPSEDYKIFSQNLSFFNYRKSICLLSTNLDVLLKIDMQRVEKVQ